MKVTTIKNPLDSIAHFFKILLEWGDLFMSVIRNSFEYIWKILGGTVVWGGVVWCGG